MWNTNLVDCASLSLICFINFLPCVFLILLRRSIAKNSNGSFVLLTETNVVENGKVVYK